MLTCPFPRIGEQFLESTGRSEFLRGRECSDAEYEAAVRRRRSPREPSRIGVVKRCEPRTDGGNSGRGFTAARCACRVATDLQRRRLLRGGGSDDEELKTNSGTNDTNHYSPQ